MNNPDAGKSRGNILFVKVYNTHLKYFQIRLIENKIDNSITTSKTIGMLYHPVLYNNAFHNKQNVSCELQRETTYSCM